MKKVWSNPEILELGVENTELGNAEPTTPDSSYVDSDNHKWYSYPS